MSKTLTVILNHNRKSYTNQLYESLTPYKTCYDLEVFDNGSTEANEISEYTTYSTETNCYYGGALNLVMELMLSNTSYDSLLLMNNDIILHGYNFVQHLRDVMFVEDFAVVAPAVLQPETSQCYWYQMHNWASRTTRQVKWADFMCPLLRRDVVETIYQFDNQLIYGWGQDVYTGIVCEERNWKVGVTDVSSVIHLSSQTLKDNKGDMTLSEYSNKALTGMFTFFTNINKVDKLNEMREWGRTYTHFKLK